VSEAPAAARCRACGGSFAAPDLDVNDWCERCRAQIIRRATWIARLVAALVVVLLGTLIAVLVQPTRFVAGWIALLAGTYVFVVKLVRRVTVELRAARRARSRRVR
jgi:uncharacterized paraquat-inducible protein A